METLGDNLGDIFGAKTSKNNQREYLCNFCHYKCCKKYNWDRHIMTSKHIEVTQKEQKEQNIKVYCCENCNKEYTSRNGLWKHKKICNCKQHDINISQKQITKHDINNDINIDKELMLMIIKQNKELLEIVKNGTTNINANNNNTNSHNKAFNLNFFLNETCKNAMNITDFVDSIKLQLSDLMDIGELGYVEGISKIIVKNLNTLDETIRPIHCTDKKRETMYIKDEGQWEKEDDNKTKLKKVVKKVANKNIKLLPQFREKYPDYNNSSKKLSDTYDKIVVEAMTSDEDKNTKIIKNISKITTINEK
jgi:hypothetical protein